MSPVYRTRASCSPDDELFNLWSYFEAYYANYVSSVYCLPGIGDLRYISGEADDRTGREFTEPPPVHALCAVQVILFLCIIYQVSETYATSLERLMIVLVENLPSLHISPCTMWRSGHVIYDDRQAKTTLKCKIWHFKIFVQF